MDAIDIFVSLLDDKEVERALKAFNQKTRSKNITFKKSKLMKILRSQTSKVNIHGKANKSVPNPFEFLILNYKNEHFEELSEEEFFYLMNDISTNQYPEYKKFANAIIYFPDKTKQLLSQISENIKNNKKIFEGILSFNKPEELESYMMKFSLFSPDKWQKDVKYFFTNYFDKDEQKKIEEIKDEISQWTLQELYENINKCENEIPVYIYQYTYLITHDDINESIKHCFIEEIMAALIEKNSNKTIELEKLIDSTAKGKNFITNSDEVEDIKHQLNSLTKTNNMLEKQLKQKNKEIKRIRMENEKILQSKLSEYSRSKNELEDKLKKEMDRYERELNKIKEDYNEKINVIRNENKELKNKLTEIHRYIEYTFPKNKDNTYKLAVVHHIETKIASIVYPEVLFIPVYKWTETFKSFPEDIGVIYIVREGLTNRQITCIEKDAKKLNIKIKIISAGCEKDLIEKIAILKMNEGGNVNGIY